MSNKKKMKALLFPKPWEVELIETVVPEPGPTEVLTRIDSCGICGSDVGIFQGEHWITAHDPGGHGHETGATVIAVGTNVKGISVGDHVARMGRGYAQYSTHVNVIGHGKDDGTQQLPIVRNDLTTEQISFADAVGCALNCAERAELDRINDRMGKAVIIGLGPIGLILAQILLNRGYQVGATDPFSHKRNLAKSWGAQVWDPFAYPRKSYGRKTYVDLIKEEFGFADAVFEMAGQPQTLTEAIDLVRPGFRVLIFGAQSTQVIPYVNCRRKGVELVYPEAMANSKTGKDFWDDALDLIASNDSTSLDLDSLVTSRISIDEAPEAFEKYDRESFIKVIVEPNR